jgi:hypothetical protein
MKPILLSFSILLFWPISAQATNRKTTSLPKDLSQWISRMTDCDHWAGEEPYDQQRAEEIKNAVDRLKCNDLQAEEAALRKKYRAKPEVIRKFDNAIKNAREIVS